MLERMRRWWPWFKLLLALAIIGGVGWQFAQILRRPELWAEPVELHPGWLTFSGILYVAAFCFPAYYWYRLLRVMGTRPPVRAAATAFFVSQLGKYVPGKALVVIMRASLIHPYGVPAPVAVATTIYETLTFMAAGALTAVVLTSVHALEESDRWIAALLLLLAGVPILPGVFNRLVDALTALGRKAARRQASAESEAIDLPRLRLGTLAFGLVWNVAAWGVMGLSLWAGIQAVLPEAQPWSLAAWSRCTGFVALAYVAGFLALVVPGGLGVRELILQRLLIFELGPALGAERATPVAVVLVLVLRLLWTAGEVIMAVMCRLAALVKAAELDESRYPPTTPHQDS